MKTAPIKAITLSSDGYLHVYPDIPATGDLEHIFRDASGIRWDRTDRSLVAAEPPRWNVQDLFKQMIFAVMNEYGIKLQITQSTAWVGVPDGLKTALAND